MFLKLFGRDTLLRIHDDRDGHKPLRQRNAGIVKDRARGNGELLFAGRLQALIDVFADILGRRLPRDPANLVIATGCATNLSIWPTHPLEEGKTLFFGTQFLDNIYKIHGVTYKLVTV